MLRPLVLLCLLPLVALARPPKSSSLGSAKEDELVDGLSRGDVRAVMRSIGPSAQACYERQRATTPALAGLLHLSFTIGTTGKVTAVTVEESSLNNARLERCVSDLVGAVSFPPQRAAFAVSWPFLFAPDKEAGTDADDVFLRALMWALEPAPLEIRARAIENLGLYGDARALNPLAQLSVDPNPRIAAAAVRAVGSFRHPRAEEILGNIVRHPTLPEPLKVFAVGLLPFQNSPSALRMIQTFSRTSGIPFGVQSAARRIAADVERDAGGKL